jgi:hypothetical protein
MKRAPIILQRFDGKVDLTALFARLPDEIVLDISARDFDEGSPERCLCGWALRESLAQAAGVDAGDVDVLGEGATSYDIVEPLAERFGGTPGEWSAVYWGITGDSAMPIIEAAWTERVMQAAGVLA